MNAIDAADEAEYNRVQSVLVERKPLYLLSNNASSSNCNLSGNICQSLIDPSINIDDYFSGARIITRAGYVALGLGIGTVIGLFVATKIPNPIASGVAGLFTIALVTLLINATIAPYEVEVISDLESEFKKAQNSGQPLTIGYAPKASPNLQIPFGGNYIVDGDGDGKGIYVNTPAANLTVHIFDQLFGLNMPAP